MDVASATSFGEEEEEGEEHNTPGAFTCWECGKGLAGRDAERSKLLEAVIQFCQMASSGVNVRQSIYLKSRRLCGAAIHNRLVP